MNKRVILLLAFLLLSVTSLGQAEEDTSIPQLLFRQDNRLYLADIEGDTILELPNIEADHRDAWRLSPNGHFLLGLQLLSDDYGDWSFRIYDIKNLRWHTTIDDFIENSSDTAEWSPNGNTILYATSEGEQGKLYLYDIESGVSRLIYETPEPEGINARGIRLYDFAFSPNGQYALFIDYVWWMGGTDNFLNLINLNNGDVQQLYGQYYASYNPIWSHDGTWILIDLHASYYSPGIIDDGEYGDVFIIASADGSYLQLTESPEIREANLQWLEDGQTIRFTSFSEFPDTVSMSLEDILANSELEPENIPRTTEPYSEIEVEDDNHYPSPDGNWFAEVIHENGDTLLYITHLETAERQLIAPADTFIAWR